MKGNTYLGSWSYKLTCQPLFLNVCPAVQSRFCPGEYKVDSFEHMRKKLSLSESFGFFFSFLSLLPWDNYHILLEGYGTPPWASHETQPCANNWKRCRIGPWLSRLLMSAAVLVFGFGGVLRFCSKSLRQLHLHHIGSDSTAILADSKWTPSVIVSMAPQSLLTPEELGFSSYWKHPFSFWSSVVLQHSWDQFQGCALEGNYSHSRALAHYNNTLAVEKNMSMQISSITCRILMATNHSLQASKWYFVAISIVKDSCAFWKLPEYLIFIHLGNESP